MIRRIALCLCIVCLLTALPSCRSGDGTDNSNPYLSVTDALGNEVTLFARPQRVAVLFSSLAEVYTLAGGEVAVSVGESVERGILREDVLLVHKKWEEALSALLEGRAAGPQGPPNTGGLSHLKPAMSVSSKDPECWVSAQIAP